MQPGEVEPVEEAGRRSRRPGRRAARRPAACWPGVSSAQRGLADDPLPDATGAIGSSGPGPPLAAPEEVDAPACGPSVRATAGASPPNIRSVTRTWVLGSVMRDGRRREVAGRRRRPRAWWAGPRARARCRSACGRRGRPPGRARRRPRRRGRRTAGRGSRCPRARCAAGRASSRRRPAAAAGVGVVGSASASSSDSPSDGLGRRRRRSDGLSDAVAVGVAVGRSSAPSERGGLPAARRAAASITAGSTSQVSGRSPAATPKSTRARSWPPGESVAVQPARSAMPAVGVVPDGAPDRDDQGGVDGAVVVAGTSGRKVRARPSATLVAPVVGLSRARARRTSRRRVAARSG